MYCEKAGRDCRYLEIVEAWNSMAVVNQASTKEVTATYAEQLQRGVERVQKGGEICDEVHCRIVAGAIMGSIFDSAHLETVEKFMTGELDG